MGLLEINPPDSVTSIPISVLGPDIRCRPLWRDHKTGGTDCKPHSSESRSVSGYAEVGQSWRWFFTAWVIRRLSGCTCMPHKDSNSMGGFLYLTQTMESKLVRTRSNSLSADPVIYDEISWFINRITNTRSHFGLFWKHTGVICRTGNSITRKISIWSVENNSYGGSDRTVETDRTFDGNYVNFPGFDQCEPWKASDWIFWDLNPWLAARKSCILTIKPRLLRTLILVRIWNKKCIPWPFLAVMWVSGWRFQSYER